MARENSKFNRVSVNECKVSKMTRIHEKLIAGCQVKNNRTLYAYM